MGNASRTSPGGAAARAAAVQPVRIWDLPTRVFHWALAVCVTGLVITGNVGGNAMAWHFRLGYAVLTLLLFRIVWGVVGGRWSRFVHFVRGPGTIGRYLRGRAEPGEHLDVGHNPLGALSVLALLTLLLLQASFGLVADDEIANVGPLNKYVDASLAAAATAWHKGAGKLILIALVVLHIGAIVYYRVRKGQNLVAPMIGGDKHVAADVPPARDDRVTRGLALVLLLACSALVAFVVTH